MAITWLLDEIYNNDATHAVLHLKNGHKYEGLKGFKYEDLPYVQIDGSTDNSAAIRILYGSSEYPQLSIRNSYTNNSVSFPFSNVINKIDKLKQKGENAKAVSRILSNATGNVTGSSGNFIEDTLNETANFYSQEINNFVQSELSELFGKSRSEIAFYSTLEYMKMWRDTEVDIAIPSFRSILYPRYSEKKGVITPLDQLEALLYYSAGKFKEYDKNSGGLAAMFDDKNGNSTIASKLAWWAESGAPDYPWFSYLTPNGFNQNNWKTGTSDKVMNNTFFITYNSYATVNNLLLNNLSITPSKTIIKDSSGSQSYPNYPSYIEVNLSFEYADRKTVNDIKDFFSIPIYNYKRNEYTIGK